MQKLLLSMNYFPLPHTHTLIHLSLAIFLITTNYSNTKILWKWIKFFVYEKRLHFGVISKGEQNIHNRCSLKEIEWETCFLCCKLVAIIIKDTQLSTVQSSTNVNFFSKCDNLKQHVTGTKSLKLQILLSCSLSSSHCALTTHSLSFVSCILHLLGIGCKRVREREFYACAGIH